MTNPMLVPEYGKIRNTVLAELLAQGVERYRAQDVAFGATEYGILAARGEWKYGPPKKDKYGAYARAMELAKGSVAK